MSPGKTKYIEQKKEYYKKTLAKMKTSEAKGLIFNIERYAIEDGPGIRTLVFMKGCPLRCIWCANPEGEDSHASLRFVQEKCERCKRCIEVCPVGAIIVSERGHIKTDRRTCISCGKCAQECRTGARELVGEYLTVQEVMEEVEKDKPFYARSNGGITLSGGEPFAQPQFALELLKRSNENGINTVVETCGHTEWIYLRKALEYTDLIYYDIKHMDPVRHRELTGASNELILENAKRISEEGIPMIIRVPVVPGCNDSEDNIRDVAEFVAKLKGSPKRVELLPYHGLGESKYRLLGREYKLKGIRPPNKALLQNLKKLLEELELNVQIGG